MKLYFRPNSISLAARMILTEGGVPFESEELDGSGKHAVASEDHLAISAFGATPALEITDGCVLTHPSAILQYCADLSGIAAFSPAIGTSQRARLQDAMGVVGDLHRMMTMMSEPLIDDDQHDNIVLVSLSRKALVAIINRMLRQIDAMLPASGGYWLGAYTPVDAYLFSILRWIPGLNWDLVEPVDLSSCVRIQALTDKIANRPSTQAALQSEGLR